MSKRHTASTQASGRRARSCSAHETWPPEMTVGAPFHLVTADHQMSISPVRPHQCSSCFADGLNGSFSLTFAGFRVQTRFVRNRPNSNADDSVYAALQLGAGGLPRCMCRRGRLRRRCVWERAGNHNLDQSSRQSGRWEMTAGGIRPLVMNEKGSEL